MIKNFRRGSFYQIAVSIALLLISTNILVKAFIWPFAVKKIQDIRRYDIYIRRRFDDPVRYTTRHKQRLFNASEHLLTGAFIIFFTTLTFKLAKTPNVFNEEM
jgi:hypothetical protein